MSLSPIIRAPVTVRSRLISHNQLISEAKLLMHFDPFSPTRCQLGPVLHLSFENVYGLLLLPTSQRHDRIVFTQIEYPFQFWNNVCQVSSVIMVIMVAGSQ